MGVYIKGVEMPTNDTVLLRIYPKGELNEFYVEQLAIDEDTIGEYWAVELPPHGRLIDADELMLKILDYIEEYSDVDEKGWHNLKWCAMKEAEMAIKNAPTIIEAEEGE